MPKSCETCTHWNPIKGLVRTGAVVGQCHACPPKGDFAWPRTRSNDFCSQHTGEVQFAQTAPAKPAAVPSEPAPTEPAQLTLDAGTSGDAPQVGASTSGTGNRRSRTGAPKA